MKRAISVLIALTVLAACSTAVGTKFDPARAAELKPGVSTEQDAVALFGQPSSRTNAQDGRYMLQWSYAEGHSGMLGIGSGGEAARLAIVFTPDGKMSYIRHSAETGMR